MDGAWCESLAGQSEAALHPGTGFLDFGDSGAVLFWIGCDLQAFRLQEVHWELQAQPELVGFKARPAPVGTLASSQGFRVLWVLGVLRVLRL